MARTVRVIVAVVVLGVAVVGEAASAARAQEAPGNCSAGELGLSAHERTAPPRIVTLEVTVDTTADCAIEDLTALLIDAQGMPVPGVPAAEFDVNRTVEAGSPELIATLLWRNWCNDPAIGPYGVALKTRGADLTVPRLASIPLCFDETQDVILQFELSAPSGQQVRPGLLSIGRRIEGQLRAGDAAAVADLYETREFTCPGDPVPVFACEDQPDGTVITGYGTGIWASQGRVFDREGAVRFLERGLAQFASDDIRLYTVAEGGFGCPECGVLVFSTPADIANDDGTVSIFAMSTRASGGQFRIFNVIGGSISLPQEAAVVLGGQHDERTYISIEPGAPQPPATGTGLMPDRSYAPVWLFLLALLLFARGVVAVMASPRSRPSAKD